MERFAGELGSEMAPRVAARLELMSRETAASPQAVLAAGIASHVAAANDMNSMAQRIAGAAAHVRSYDDPVTLVKARGVTPIVTLLRRASEAATDADGRHALLRELVTWFKRDFFKWVNTVACSGCGGGTTASGGAPPTPAERAQGAGMCEIHTCNACGVRNRFPRYNAPQRLLETRAGRCGEWANAFTCVALAWGFDARHVTDWSDHVWTEVWSRSHCRWLHVDACEAAVDSPLMYESGWGKKLSFIVAAGRTHVTDVTRSYTKKWLDVVSRRAAVPAAWLASFIAAVSSSQMATAPHLHSGTAAFETARAAVCERDMQACIAWDDGVRKEEETSGRISGSLAWRVARHETGHADASAATAASRVPVTQVLRWAAVHEGGARGVVGMTAWGGHVLAVTDASALLWRPAPMEAVDTANDEAVKRARWRGITLTDAGVRIRAVAAIQKSQKFMALCDGSTADDGMVLSIVQPLDGSKAWRVSLAHCAVLPSGAGGAAVSILCVRDSVFVIAAGTLWLCSAAVPALVDTLDGSSGSTAVPASWLRVCDAAHVSSLACVGAYMFGYARPPGADAGHIVLLTRFAADAHTPRVLECAAAQSSSGTHATVHVRMPMCGVVGAALTVDVAAPATAPLTAHWMCLHTYGQPPQAGVRHATDLRNAVRVDDEWCRVTWPTRARPTASGLYTLAYFNGVGYGSIVGATALPLVVVEDDGMAWTRLCPASNVTALTGAGSDRLVAVTAAGDMWSLVLPALLCGDTDAAPTAWALHVPVHAKLLDVLSTSATSPAAAGSS